MPYKADAGPLKIVKLSIIPRGRLSTCPWPSGVVSGIPSTINLIPLIPKADLAPKPLIESLRSWAKLFAFCENKPGTPSRYSSSDSCFKSFWEKLKFFCVTANGKSFFIDFMWAASIMTSFNSRGLVMVSFWENKNP